MTSIKRLSAGVIAFAVVYFMCVTSLMAQTGSSRVEPVTFAGPGLALGFVAILIYGMLIFGSIGLLIWIIWMLYDLLRAVPPQFRKMEPGQVWLLLIPLFNVVWMFFVFIQIPQSYQKMFNHYGRYDVQDCNQTLGILYCASGFVPCLGAIAAPILLIMFLVNMYSLKGQIPVLLQQQPVAGMAVPVASPYPPQKPLM